IGETAFAEVIWTEASRTDAGDWVGTGTIGQWRHWPEEAEWVVPIPEWATGADVLVIVNPRTQGLLYGNLQLDIGGEFIGIPTIYDIYNQSGGVTRETIIVSGTYVIPPTVRGTRATMKLMAQPLE